MNGKIPSANMVPYCKEPPVMVLIIENKSFAEVL